MKLLLAAAPILLIVFLMVFRRWGAARAGAAGYLSALVIAITVFGAGILGLAYAHLKAILLAFDVLYIIWAAYANFRIADEAGAIDTIGSGLRRLTDDQAGLALILGFAFASFLQGIGGFGVPIAIVAPMLVGLGFSPLAAVVVPAIGHTWAVTFGSLGSSFQALMAATGLPGEQLDVPAALMLGLMAISAGFCVVHAVGGMAPIRRLWPRILALGLIMGGVQLGLASAGLWNLAATGAGGMGLLASVFLAADRKKHPGPRADGARSVWTAMSGYIVLVAIMMAVQLIEPLKAFLGGPALSVPFPEISTSLGYTVPAGTGRVIHWFSHGGAILIYASLASFLIYRSAGWLKPGAAGRVLSATLRGVLSSSISIVAMVSMAVVMSHAGMTDALARGMADAVGAGFPLIAPWIGAFGAFMTGSNTNSNVVFAALQQRTADILSLKAPWILAAQTAGGAVGSVIAPTKVVVGAATAGMEGREGEVIRRLAVYVMILVAVLSAAAWVAAR